MEQVLPDATTWQQPGPFPLICIICLASVGTGFASQPIYSTSSAFPKPLAYYLHFYSDFFIGLPSRLGDSQFHEVRVYVLFLVSISYYVGYYQICTGLNKLCIIFRALV